MKKWCLFFALFLPRLVLSQSEPFGLWSTAEIEKKWGKKWSTALQFQTRHANKASYLQTYFWDASLGYKLTKNLEISANYRNIHRKKNENKAFKKRDRYYADLSYSTKFAKIKWNNRLRYQHQFKDNDGLNEFDASYLRFKTGVALASKSKWVPYINADLFYLIQDKSINQIRPKLGLDYKFDKHNTLGCGLQRDVSTISGVSNGPLTWAVNYSFKF